MFRDVQPSSLKKATAAETLQIIDDLCIRLGESVHPLALAIGVADVICFYGWTPAELALYFENSR